MLISPVSPSQNRGNMLIVTTTDTRCGMKVTVCVSFLSRWTTQLCINMANSMGSGKSSSTVMPMINVFLIVRQNQPELK